MSSAALGNLRKDAELRILTDRQLSIAWIFLPIIAVVVTAAAVAFEFILISAVFASGISSAPTSQAVVPSFAAGLGAVFFIPFIAEFLYLYFFYLLIRRRNQHFARQQRFFSDLALVLREAAARKSVNVDGMLGSMESTNRQAQVDEGEKSAVLWVVLLIVPFVSLFALLYILYFLTGDYHRHERREDSMLSDTEKALSLLGVPFVFRRNNPVPHRSYAVYLVVSIITFGIFALYWEYVLIKDPNNHFADHAVFEGTLVQAVTPL